VECRRKGSSKQSLGRGIPLLKEMGREMPKGKKIMSLLRCRIIFGCPSSDGLTGVQI
jgi:hypothetical protein